MSSETSSAPEISGWGSPQPASNDAPRLKDHEVSTLSSSNASSSLSRRIALFTIVGLVALFIPVVLSGSTRYTDVVLSGSTGYTDENGQRDNANVAARVDKILSQTPLIG